MLINLNKYSQQKMRYKMFKKTRCFGRVGNAPETVCKNKY